MRLLCTRLAPGRLALKQLYSALSSVLSPTATWWAFFCPELGLHLGDETGNLAEAVRFELTEHCCSAVFKTAGLNHSPKLPEARIIPERHCPHQGGTGKRSILRILRRRILGKDDPERQYQEWRQDIKHDVTVDHDEPNPKNPKDNSITDRKAPQNLRV